jgi:ubiquinone/menaquinone biosynthesis C-methylase UbiE
VTEAHSEAQSEARTQRWRRYWDRQSRRYDRSMSFWDRHLFRDSRAWICGQAHGRVLEVAVGTGLNLPYYPPGVELTGIDFSPQMLALARRRAGELDLSVELREGDAQRLDLPDGSFDTVVCTYGLCTIPDERQAVTEMARVLRPGGLLLLADHIAARSPLLRGLQRAIEVASVPFGSEHFRRHPAELLPAAGLTIERRERFGPSGIVERLTARKPDQAGR